jgi:hypothetical protein
MCAVVLIVAKSATKGGSIETQCVVRWVIQHVWCGAGMRSEGRSINGSALLKAELTAIRSAFADQFDRSVSIDNQPNEEQNR